MSSPAAIADQALKAFNSSDYVSTIILYSKALELAPTSPDYYLKRSTAYQRSNPPQYDHALVDAERAVKLANLRGKRELIGSAQLRRGIALHLLKRYGDAKFCFLEAEKRCAEKEKNTLGIWMKKVDIVLEDLEEEDPGREVTVEAIPDVVIPEKMEEKKNPATVAKTKEPEEKKVETAAPSVPLPPTAGVITPASKIRHEWYQTQTHVVLTIYVKGVPKDKATIEIEEKSVSVTFPLPTGNDFVFHVDPLYNPVVVNKSSFKIYGTKIELSLVKATPGKKWADLEAITPDDSPAEGPTISSSSVASVTPAQQAPKPVYPTSSKSGPKDWDKLAADLSKKPIEKKGVDDEYDSDEGGDPVNHFFKKLYKDADDDTRRAMMKSYIESNGTALSTNWQDVGKGKVETSPPDGMEAKPWDK